MTSQRTKTMLATIVVVLGSSILGTGLGARLASSLAAQDARKKERMDEQIFIISKFDRKQVGP